MSTLSLRLPDSTHRRLREWAKKDHVSVNQFIASAVTEKLAALSTQEYIEVRAKRADRTKFEAVLAKVPNVEPRPEDDWK